jgi:hypothetical protein
VRDVDMLDGTPVLDIKPYVPWTDAIPEAREGWLDDEALAQSPSPASRPSDPLPPYEVGFAPHALEQLAFLRDHGIEIEDTVRAILAQGPQPHAYRRIKLARDGTGLLAVKSWRVRFATHAEARRVEVVGIASGYRKSELENGTDTPALTPHRAFVSRYGLSE